MRLGHAVNLSISLIFLIVFIFVASLKGNAPIVDFISIWLSISNPFDAALIGQNPTILIMAQGFNTIILFCHLLISLFVARESVLILIDEVLNKSISQFLDRKMYLNIESQGFVTETRKENIISPVANPTHDSDDLDSAEERKVAVGGVPEIMRESQQTEKVIETVYRMTYMKLPLETKNKWTWIIMSIVVALALINVPLHP